ncbi:MAG: dephospho-CoA kinase [Solirubrobacterales bacterium]
MDDPPFIGLTGSTGAGKSTVLAVLEKLGAATISSDAIVHELLSRGELRDLLVERWGEEVAPDGEVDRSRIAAIVFKDRDELGWLESQLHPRVGARVAEWREGLEPEVKLAVNEVPLLFETGMEAAFDAVLCVVAPLELRSERAAGRGLAELEGRDGRQIPEAEKAARSDFVVVNDGTREELEARLDELLPELETARK